LKKKKKTGPNPMRKISVDRVVLNMGVGEPGKKLDLAQKLIERISGVKSVKTKTKRRIPSWGLRPGLEVGVMCTVRGKKAVDLLKRLLEGIENKLKDSCFDTGGNVNFGVKEYITIPDEEYDPEIGIVGFNVTVSLIRPGYRVKLRSRHRSKIGRPHLVSKEEAIKFMKSKFGVDVI
jgi:large subunit ribosomal protein L5